MLKMLYYDLNAYILYALICSKKQEQTRCYIPLLRKS